MINEVTKTVSTVPVKKYGSWSKADAGDQQDNRVTGKRQEQDSSNSCLSALSLEHQQQLMCGDNLYKCSSGDSLASLQNFVSSSSLQSTLKKFIVEDNSDYGQCNSSSTSLNSSGICSVPGGLSCTVTNFLRPRMEFSGYQISGYKKYQVIVTLKTVDLPKDGISSLSPHLTGFLTIRGLTNHHPEISTYFESFAVTHTDLGFLSSTWSKDPVLSAYKADDQTDLEHWLNFPSFKQLFLEGNNGSPRTPTIHDLLNGKETFDNYLENRFIFMRWKEKFLVPDALIDGVEGASYDGFYYIVHDQVTGTIQGFYYHEDAEKFQQLELVPSLKSLNDCGNCEFEFA